MLEDKVIIVTGAAVGTGRSTAELCAERGARVVVADLDGASAEQAVREITAAGGQAIAHQGDLTVEAYVAALADAAVSAFGRIDALHNNAYAVHPDAVADVVNTTVDGWDWAIRACLTGQLLCCRAVLPHMLEQRSGSLINVSSGNGMSGSTGTAAYGWRRPG